MKHDADPKANAVPGPGGGGVSMNENPAESSACNGKGGDVSSKGSSGGECEESEEETV